MFSTSFNIPTSPGEKSLQKKSDFRKFLRVVDRLKNVPVMK